MRARHARRSRGLSLLHLCDARGACDGETVQHTLFTPYRVGNMIVCLFYDYVLEYALCSIGVMTPVVFLGRKSVSSRSAIMGLRYYVLRTGNSIVDGHRVRAGPDGPGLAAVERWLATSQYSAIGLGALASRKPLDSRNSTQDTPDTCLYILRHEVTSFRRESRAVPALIPAQQLRLAERADSGRDHPEFPR